MVSVAIALIVIFPSIATWFPERLQAEARGVVTEEVEGGTSLEDYQPGGTYGTELREALEQEQQEGEEPAKEEGSGDSLEQDEMTTKKK